jgi:hypothetical protein
MQVGTIFALVTAIIVIGMILVFGADQISNLVGLSGQAQLQKSVLDIEGLNEEVFNMARGSSRTHIVNLPTGTRLCFIDVSDPGRAQTTTNIDDWWCPGNPTCISGKDNDLIVDYMILNEQSQLYKSNMWIYDNLQEMGTGYRIPYMAPACPIGVTDRCSFCISTGTEIFLQNAGPVVEVSLK